MNLFLRFSGSPGLRNYYEPQSPKYVIHILARKSDQNKKFIFGRPGSVIDNFTV